MFEEALAINPEYVGAWYGLGVGFARLKKYQKSKKYFEKALELNPLFEPSLISLAALSASLDSNNDALFYFNKLIDLNPKLTSAWWGKAMTLRSMGRNSESEACLKEAINSNPKIFRDFLNELEKNNVPTIHNWTKLFENLVADSKSKIEQDSLIEFLVEFIPRNFVLIEEGKTIKETFIEIYENLSDLHNEVLQLIFNLKFINPLEKGIFLGLYLQAIRKNNLNRMIELYIILLKILPLNYRLWIILGDTHLKIDEYTKAAICFEKSLDIYPNDYHLWRRLGTIYLIIKNYNQAIRCTSKALELNPIEYQLLLDLSLYYEHTGEIEKSIQYINLYIDKNPDDLKAIERSRELEKRKMNKSDLQKITCSKCGFSTNINDNFCEECGNSLK